MVPSYLRVLGGVAPKGDGMDPSFVNGLAMHYPDTSAMWLALLLVPAAALAWKAWRERAVFWLVALALLGLQAASASSVVRLHYAHRYALPHVAQAPTVVLSGVAHFTDQARTGVEIE